MDNAVEEGTNPVVDDKLILEKMDTRFVDLFSSVTIVLFSSVDWAPFSIPHTQSTVIQPFPLPLILLDESPDLAFAADIPLW